MAISLLRYKLTLFILFFPLYFYVFTGVMIIMFQLKHTNALLTHFSIKLPDNSEQKYSFKLCPLHIHLKFQTFVRNFYNKSCFEKKVTKNDD